MSKKDNNSIKYEKEYIEIMNSRYNTIIQQNQEWKKPGDSFQKFSLLKNSPTISSSKSNG